MYTLEQIIALYLTSIRRQGAKQIAISENVVGMKIFESPIFAFGSADDENFKLLKEPSVIWKHFLIPEEWLHGGIEGQALLNKLCIYRNINSDN